MSAALALEPQDRPAAPAPAAATAGLLRFITCGSVDDGKSTLIGRLLYDAGAVPQDQLDAAERDSKRFGTQGPNIDLALLVDGLAAEREQGITIDVAYRYFSTPRRAFIVADTPGHEQYTRNMATGASSADLAVILVDARKGVLPQTRRHAFIVAMVGVRHVVVAINKMDLVGYDESVYARIRDDFTRATATLGFVDVSFVPVSALAGDNVAAPSAATPWYAGPSLLAYLEGVQVKADERLARPFRLPVQWVNRPGPDFRGFAGTVAAGTVRPGDAVRILPSGVASRVARVVGGSGDLPLARAGDAATIVLVDEVDASRGDVVVAAADALGVASGFAGRLLWMADTPAAGRSLLLRQGHTTANAALAVRGRVDIHSFDEMSAGDLDANAIGRVHIRADRPLALAPYAGDRDLGAFILVDRVTNETVALGVIDAVDPLAAASVEGRSVGAEWRPLAEQLLLGVPSGSAGALAEEASWRVVSAAGVGLLVGLLLASPGMGLLAAAADLLLRTPLRAAHGAIARRLRDRARADAVSDGGGI
jgi:bifunctional enzyme CysN/CysC